MSKPTRESATTFVARSIRGIEPILAAEIRGRLRGEVLAMNHRTVEFRTASWPSSSDLRLGSADDVFLYLGEAGGIDKTAKSLAVLGTAAEGWRFDAALEALGRSRSAALPNRFTVVASFLGRRNYNRYAIEDTVADVIASTTGLTHESSRDGASDRPVLTFRIHLVDDRATLAIRWFDEPLHRRAYKQRSFAGTLHPPLAYAMTMLAGILPGYSVLDPFCGAGTILIEGASLQPMASYRGSDLESERVSGALENAQRAAAKIDVMKADAGKLALDAASVDIVVTNPPWGMGVDLRGELEAEPSQFLVELARVLRPEGRAVLLVGSNALESIALPAPLRRLLRLPLSLFGQHPEIWVLSSGISDPLFFDVAAPFGAELLEAWASSSAMTE
jgi:tRNA (guanine6-N2)-methyltransferase